MKIIISILALFVTAGSFAQKGGVPGIKWEDESSADKMIPAESFTFAKKANLYYYLSNDKENVYVRLRITDTEVQSKILNLGLTIWINMDGKTSKTIGLKFPIGAKNPASRRGMEKSPDGLTPSPLAMANTIELIGFTTEENRRLPAQNAESFTGSIKYDKDGVLHYWMKMPLEKMPLRNAKTGGGEEPFTIGFEYPLAQEMGMGGPGGPGGPGAPAGEMPAMAPAGGSPRGGGGGGRQGGGGGVPMARPPMGSQGSAKPPVLFWVKEIKLGKDK